VSERWILATIGLVLAITIFAAFRNPPVDYINHLLRRTGLATATMFIVSSFFLLHSALASMKQGDFSEFWVPFVSGTLVLPHPYDYFLYQFLRYSALCSLPTSVVSFAAYWVRARLKKPNIGVQ